MVLVISFWQQAENKAVVARNSQAKTLKADADTKEALRKVKEMHKLSEQRNAMAMFDVSLGLAEKGNVRSGILEMSKSLQKCIDVHDGKSKWDDITNAIRRNINAWDAEFVGNRFGVHYGDWITGVDFSPNGMISATVSVTGEMEFHDNRTGSRLGKRFKEKLPLWSVAFNPDGHTCAIAAGSKDVNFNQPKPGYVKLVQMPKASDSNLHEIAYFPHPIAVRSVRFNEDGSRMLSRCVDGSVRVWQKEEFRGKTDWKMRALIREPYGTILKAIFSPDGETILTGSYWFDRSGVASLFDAATGARLGQPMLHTHPVRSVAFRPDGKMIATGSGLFSKENPVGEVRLWKTETCERILPKDPLLQQDLQFNGPIYTVRFSPNGKMLFSGGVHENSGAVQGIFKMWNTDETIPSLKVGERAYFAPIFLPAPVWSVDFSPDGRVIVTGCEDGNCRFFHATSGRKIGNPIMNRGTVSDVRYNSVGNLAMGTSLTSDGNSYVVNAPKSFLTDVPIRLTSVAFHMHFLAEYPHQLIVAGTNKAYRFHIRKREEVEESPVLREGEFNALGVHPNGHLLCFGDESEHLLFHDLKTGTHWSKPLPEHQDYDKDTKGNAYVTDILFHRDGNTILVLQQAKSYNRALWLTKDGNLISQLDSRDVNKGKFKRLRFIDKGNTVHILSETKDHYYLTSWNPISNTTSLVWNITNDVADIEISPSGRIGLIMGHEESCQMLDAFTGKKIGTAMSSQDRIGMALFNPEETTIAMIGRSTVRLWDVKSCKQVGTIMEHPHRILSATFTPDGKQLFVATEGEYSLLWDVPEVLQEDPDKIQTALEFRTNAEFVHHNLIKLLKPGALLSRYERYKNEPFSLAPKFQSIQRTLPGKIRLKPCLNANLPLPRNVQPQVNPMQRPVVQVPYGSVADRDRDKQAFRSKEDVQPSTPAHAVSADSGK